MLNVSDWGNAAKCIFDPVFWLLPRSTLTAVFLYIFSVFVLSLRMRRPDEPDSWVGKVSHTQRYSHYLQTDEQAGSAGPASAMLPSRYYLSTAPNQVMGGRMGDPNKWTTDWLSGRISQEGQKTPQRKTAEDWARSLAVCCCCCCFPRPSRRSNIRRENAADKTSALCFVFGCLPAGERGEAHGHVCFSLTVVTFLNAGRVELLHVFSPPAVCPKNPFRLHRNPQTPLPSHHEMLNWTRWNGGCPVQTFTIKAFVTKVRQDYFLPDICDKLNDVAGMLCNNVEFP